MNPPWGAGSSHSVVNGLLLVWELVWEPGGGWRSPFTDMLVL